MTCGILTTRRKPPTPTKGTARSAKPSMRKTSSSAGRVPGDEVRYNEIARRVMQKHGVAIDDLYSFALPRLAEIQLPANVHFKPEGSKQLADQVAASILKALDSK